MKEFLSSPDNPSGSTDMGGSIGPGGSADPRGPRGSGDNGAAGKPVSPAPIEIDPSKDHFVRDGKPFFYLADTVWSTFTNPTLDEWIEYLEYRKRQGYNVLQINILPQWDRSVSTSEADRSVSQGKEQTGASGPPATAPEKSSPEPFQRKADGTYNFSEINREYFDRACRFLDEAVVRGFTPALVVLWCDYVENTWASKMVPGHVMPLDQVGPYTEFVVKTFKWYRPIYIVSGDTGFKSSRGPRTLPPPRHVSR